MDDIIDIRRWINAVLRRWYLIAAPTVLGAMIAALIAFALPSVYEADALIIVESQQIPSDLARSTVTVNTEQTVRVIEQRLTSRQNLLDIAERFSVFPDTLGLSSSEIVRRMRAGTSISSSGIGRRRGGAAVTTVEIAFRAERPNVAAAVANEFVTQLLEQNAEQRSARAAETVSFFDQEVERLGAELASIEDRIAAFRRANSMALPSSLGARRDELANLQRSAFVRESRRLGLVDRRRALEETLSLFDEGAGGGGTAVSRELSRLQSQLAQRRALYAESHPTIRTLTAQIAALETQMREAAVEEETDESPVDFEVARRRSELVREIERIEAELELLDDQEEAEAERMGLLERSIAATPDVSVALNALERERDAIQIQFRSATQKRAEAETGERLEVNRQAERLEIVEQATAPDQPISPNRILIAGLGTAAGLGLGAGLLVLIELLNFSLRTTRDFERTLSIRPVSVIPYIRTEAEIRSRRLLMRAAVLVILIVVPGTIWFVDQTVAPIRFLAEQAFERTGLEQFIGMVETRFAR
jgi:polysaccharide chain length determinant protein (PEP-CTERM system associated)